MRNITPLLLLLATGCGPDLIGDWEGECDFNTYDFDIELEIDEVDGRDFTGDVDAVLRTGNDPVSYSGTLEGTRDGLEVDITLTMEVVSGPQAGNQARVELEGEIDDDQITGECDSEGTDGELDLDFQG
ncbi:MAG: hypothetical protein AAFU79_30035 [Myxococcota bacterium]